MYSPIPIHPTLWPGWRLLINVGVNWVLLMTIRAHLWAMKTVKMHRARRTQFRDFDKEQFRSYRI